MNDNKKSHIWWEIPLVFIVLFLIFESFFLGKNLLHHNSKNTISQSSKKTIFGIPVRIKIPSIKLDANIQQLGIANDGSMEVPKSLIDVGWYKWGPRPGAKGSAVIDGHLNGPHYALGVFDQLQKLKRGDNVYIVDNNGKSILFVVRETRTFSPQSDTNEVFNKTDGYHLNLITCEGVWNSDQHSYSERRVVFADLAL